MPTLGLYCKAYYASDFMKFAGWADAARSVKHDVQEVDGDEADLERPLQEHDYLFLHESLVVTDGIFEDEHVVFDRITPEWQAFCRDTLKFEAPQDGAPANDALTGEALTGEAQP
jgi:hypothetical protein